jgi:hypothetical protein
VNEVWKQPSVSLEAYRQMIGQEIGVSSWHLIDQKRIDLYADVIEEFGSERLILTVTGLAL